MSQDANKSYDDDDDDYEPRIKLNKLISDIKAGLYDKNKNIRSNFNKDDFINYINRIINSRKIAKKNKVKAIKIKIPRRLKAGFFATKSSDTTDDKFIARVNKLRIDVLSRKRTYSKNNINSSNKTNKQKNNKKSNLKNFNVVIVNGNKKIYKIKRQRYPNDLFKFKLMIGKIIKENPMVFYNFYKATCAFVGVGGFKLAEKVDRIHALYALLKNPYHRVWFAVPPPNMDSPENAKFIEHPKKRKRLFFRIFTAKYKRLQFMAKLRRRQKKVKKVYGKKEKLFASKLNALKQRQLQRLLKDITDLEGKPLAKLR